MRDLIAAWFSLRRPVDRSFYALSGICLMAFKYAVDLALVYLGTGRVWSPLDYLAPRLLADAQAFAPDSGHFFVLLLLWTLPFVWIGASMTARRALDAGFPAATGLVFFVPIANYLWMLALCAFPSVERLAEEARPDARESDTPLPAVLRAAVPAALFGTLTAALGVLVLEHYGAFLFLGIPYAMGFAASLRARALGVVGRLPLVAAGQLSLVLAAGLFLVLALEGGVCLVMALPPAALLAFAGSAMVSTLPGTARSSGSAASLLLMFGALPGLMAAESLGPEPRLREVVSRIEIDAPAGRVWQHVIGFSELPPPTRLAFRLGIAFPQRARIEGSGVGAVRHCEFSTGPFVEPITAWEEPRRLAFDVASQPEPMEEWSPYQRVNAPHLVGGLVSRRGEFRLIALPHGRTRLEGSTWYTLDLAPTAYWSLWSDALIGSIHARVLDHIRALSEAA